MFCDDASPDADGVPAIPSFLWPSSSWALGLGEIHLNSALNEPMNAEIDLIAATPG